VRYTSELVELGFGPADFSAARVVDARLAARRHTNLREPRSRRARTRRYGPADDIAMLLELRYSANIQDKEDIPPDQQCLTKQFEDGHVKANIQDKEGIQASQIGPRRCQFVCQTDGCDYQCVFNLGHLYRQHICPLCIDELGDGRAPADCNIKPESTLHLALRSRGGMQIFVKTLTGNTPVAQDDDHCAECWRTENHAPMLLCHHCRPTSTAVRCPPCLNRHKVVVHGGAP